MVAAVRVHKPGGPEALIFEDVQIAAPGQGQIKIKQHACGVNFIDAYFRMGMYPSPVGMPFIAGNESAGEVMAVGPGVTDIKVGDRVAFVGPLGGYAAERVVPADRAVKLPNNITYEQAAGMMLKGMTVQYLVNRTYKVEKGTVCLIHAAAGGVGLIACQWANHLGATVIGTVGSKEKAELAKKNGCHHTILYRDEDFVAKVKDITSGKLCDVVYDGIGKTTFPASLDCLRPMGYFVSFGSASGQIDAFNINILQTKGSLFATRPTLNHYVAKRDDLIATAADLFKVVGSGAVKDSGQSEISAQRCWEGTQRHGRPRHHRLINLAAVKARRMAARAVTVSLFIVTAPQALAGGISDVGALEIVQRHCVMCHAARPTHESFQRAPKNITLKSVTDIKRYASVIYTQTVQTKAMPLGNQTGMTDNERAELGQWLRELP